MVVDRFHTVDSLDNDKWKRLGANRPFTNYSWLRFGERVYSNDQAFYHLGLAEDGRFGGAISTIRKKEPLPIQQPLFRLFISHILRNRPILSCQAPIGGFPGLILNRAGGSRPSMLQALTASLEQTLRQSQGSFLVFPYLYPDLAQHTGWSDEYFTVSLPPGTHMPIVWHDFEAYIFSRKNSVRKDYRLHANRAGRLGLVTQVMDALPDPNLADKLIRNMEMRHRSGTNPAVPDMIAQAHTVGGKWLVTEKDGIMVGCGLLLADGGSMLLTLLGLENDVPQVYFSLMYGAVRYAIEAGYKDLYGGGGAYYYKSRLGYKLMKNNFIKVYSSGRFLRRLGQYLAAREARITASNWAADTRAWSSIISS